MTPTLQLLKRLNDAGVEYVVIGGVAAVLHGAELTTKDVDICTPLQGANLKCIFNAVDPLNPRVRMRPDLMKVPEHVWQMPDLKNLYLLTDLGIIDMLGDVPGVGDYNQVREHSEPADFGEGVAGRLLSLDALILAKRAAGRPKDLEHLRNLEVVRNEKKGSP